MDYFSCNGRAPPSSQLDEQDLLDSLPPLPKSIVQEEQERELSRLTDALNHLNTNALVRPAPRRIRAQSAASSGYFGRHVGGGDYLGSSSGGGSSLSTPSLESDYSSSLSASCSPLSTPLDDDAYSYSSGPSSALDSEVPFIGIAKRRQVKLPKLEIPAFTLDASYFAKAPPKPAATKPSSFQFDVSPPRRSKNAYSSTATSTSLPAPTTQCESLPKPSTRQFTSSSWARPDPVDLAGIIGQERPGSPIRLRKKRTDYGFAF
ncbi:uncharacterized protein JCM15063_002203 [Sporobolomyces koalae]|uniref:uncharacterized protein n=1 Tax=Sporobolomyces koalae TaxID=500713 RepID=UPI003171680E